MRWLFVGGVHPLFQPGSHADGHLSNDWGDGTHGTTGGDGAGYGSTGSRRGAGYSPQISNDSEYYGIDVALLEASK